MKTKYRIIGLTFALSVFFVSCESMLDIDQHGTASFDTFYQTDQEAQEAITSVYAEFITIYFNYSFVKNLLADDYWCGGGGRGDNNELEQLNEYTFGPEHSYLKGLFQNYYRIIYLSNVVLGHVPNETDVQKQVRAEAHVFRALAYIDLISMWGTPPLVDHELAPSEYKQSNGDPALLWALVEADLKEAIESNSLTEKTSVTDDSNYRVKKQFAQALLGKAFVFQKKWAEAAAVLDQVILSGKYALYAGEYENMLTIHAKNNSESLFEVNKLNDPNNAWTNWNLYAAMVGWRGSSMTITSAVSAECWGFFNPQSDLYNAFVQAEGANGYRLNQTMKSYEAIQNQGDKIIDGKELYGHEGFFLWKTRILKAEMISGGWMASHNNMRYMRFAEVLLLAAEAHVQNGNIDKATEYVNMVRARAQLPNKASVSMEDVMLEKRLELCGEGVRFQDMMRWGIGNKMKDQGKQIPWFTSSGTIKWMEYNGEGKAGFKEKHLLLPFPETEITLNPNVKQNPGW